MSLTLLTKLVLNESDHLMSLDLPIASFPLPQRRHRTALIFHLSYSQHAFDRVQIRSALALDTLITSCPPTQHRHFNLLILHR